MVVLDVSISSLTEDWVDIFGLVLAVELLLLVVVVVVGSEVEEREEVDEVLPAGVRDFDLDFPLLLLVLLLLRVLVTAAGEAVGDCWPTLSDRLKPLTAESVVANLVFMGSAATVDTLLLPVSSAGRNLLFRG